MTAKARIGLLIGLAFVMALVARTVGQKAQTEKDWIATARKTHARFTGLKGTFAQFGDSITVSMAFWNPLSQERNAAPPQMKKAFQQVKARMRPECWRDWKGADYGSEGGQTTRWAKEHIGDWLKRLNPEVALLMFGTNDLHSLELPEYRDNLRGLVQQCLANGTVVILSTIPPRHGFEAKAAAFAEAARQLARELKVPLTDYHAEILKRRPKDWNGAQDAFRAYQDYEVPTLIARDGVHPSFPAKYQNDYSEEGLKRSGYTLRNYLTLLKYAEVTQALDAALPSDNSAGHAAPKNIGREPIGNIGRGQAPALQTRAATSEARLRGRTILFPLPKLGEAGTIFLSPLPELGEGAGVRARGSGRLPDRPWFPKAPPLPPPTGDIVRVSNTSELVAAAESAKPGQTILIKEGHYPIDRVFTLRADNVTLRGESGRRERVILDGGGTLGELLALTACSGVTLADLTVQNVRWNGIKINSETGVQKLRIYNCVLRNIWQRAVKGVLVPKENRQKRRPADCRVEYCLFTNDRAKQYRDDPADTEENFRGNYVGGIDVMFPLRWTIADNVFVGIKGRTGEARGAVFLWHDARDCKVERNIIIDCDSGICLGNSHRPEEIAIHATGCMVRNNFLTRVPENGILADYTRDCKIVHNTVFDPESSQGRLIRVVHDNDGLIVANNLLGGAEPRSESESKIQWGKNAVRVPASYFVAPEEGNLRLTERAVEVRDKAEPLPEVTEDIDRRPRDKTPDLGAHEFGAAPSPPAPLPIMGEGRERLFWPLPIMGERESESRLVRDFQPAVQSTEKTSVREAEGESGLTDIAVRDAESFRRAVQQARPGTRILVAPGTYRGSFYFSNVKGTAEKPVVIAAADPKSPPVFQGEAECLHFSEVAYLELRGLVLKGATGNGLNIDDGGKIGTPSRHVTLRDLRVSDVGPKGNRDGIKLSGLDDFVVQNCVVERWGDGGSGIDMVGCHKGRIVGCTFRQGGSNSVQTKGGASEIRIEDCRFEDYGQRGINIGGSTGLEFFRPSVASMPANGKYEARDIRVERNIFVGGQAPLAFVGADGATVRYNTIYRPGRWALRILQETQEPGFVPSRNGVFEGNIVVFQSGNWAEGGVNIGPGTAPKTFRFARNVWYCEDRPERSQPSLPTPETEALVGKDPLFRNPAQGDFTLKPGSPAAGRGASARQ